MLFDLLSGNFDRYDLISFLLQIPIVLLALSIHEAAHGYIANKMGDPTARNLGRITLNPAKHLDLFGTLCMIVTGYGWANPVPVNTRNFRNPKKGMALTALAGPVSNLISAFIFTVFYALTELIFQKFVPANERTQILYTIFANFNLMGLYLNTTLAVFNLIPVPPFDGSRIFLSFLPPKIYFGIMKYERIILMVTLLLLATGILSRPISLLTQMIANLFAGLVFKVFGIFL